MTVVVNDAVLSAFLTSPAGPVGRDLQRRAFQVQAEARMNASGTIIGIESGDLIGGIHVNFTEDADGLRATVSTPARHRGFAYPAFWDRAGRPWLSTALADGIRQ